MYRKVALAIAFLAVADIGRSVPQRRRGGGGIVFPGSTGARQGHHGPPGQDGSVSGGGCKPVNECPPLLDLMKRNPQALDEFETCGFEENVPLFDCPDMGNMDACDCKALADCEELDKLARMRDFKKLKEQKRCGYDEEREMRMYCCPSGIDKKRVKVNSGPDSSTVLRNGDMGVRMDNFFDEKASKCGVSNEKRIFGGEDALPHEHPWAVLLGYVNEARGTTMYLCGGSLVSPRYVLTAAHCINSRGGHHLAHVRLGHSDREHPDAFDVRVESVTLHPKFERHPLLVNDIALLRLAEEVPERTTEGGIVSVRPICLGREEDEIVEPEVAGWGLVDRHNVSRVLQVLDLETVDNLECEREYKTKVQGFFVEDSQLCATGVAGTDSCKGDSGGPLIYFEGDSGRARLGGITSFGTIRCDSSVPGVYTRVSAFRDWIAMVVAHDE